MKIPIVLLLVLGLSAPGATFAQNTFPASGNVGIGTTSPGYTLDVNGGARFTGTLRLTGASGINVASQEANGSSIAAYVLNRPAISITGTYYPIATTGYAQQVISANIRNNGYLMGFDGGGFRSEPADAGSLATIFGMRLQYGHYYTLNGAAQTDTIIGLSLEPYYQVGTIGNVYGLYIGGASGASVTGNIYGVYQADSNAKNYFSGNVGIGTTNPTQKLSVNGTVRAKEVIIDTGWADYVFAPDYALLPLSDVEAHIKHHQHLPGIPSASEVAEHGISVGEMQAKLLAKIEELTLHMIENEKRHIGIAKRETEQSRLINSLSDENHGLKARLDRLEQSTHD